MPVKKETDGTAKKTPAKKTVKKITEKVEDEVVDTKEEVKEEIKKEIEKKEEIVVKKAEEKENEVDTRKKVDLCEVQFSKAHKLWAGGEEQKFHKGQRAKIERHLAQKLQNRQPPVCVIIG